MGKGYSMLWRYFTKGIIQIGYERLDLHDRLVHLTEIFAAFDSSGGIGEIERILLREVVRSQKPRLGKLLEGEYTEYPAELTDDLKGSYLLLAIAIDFAKTLAEFSQPQDASDEEKKAHEKSVIDHVFEVESEMLKRDIDPVEGSLETIAKLSQVIPVAVASNSSGELLTQKMQTFGFDQYLTTWVSANDVENPKPAPDMYLEAVRRLGGDPQYALTVEDSKAGAKAAQKTAAKLAPVQAKKATPS